MLSTQEIASLINAPIKLERTEIENLRVLVDKFPFAQTFAILYLQALSNVQDILLDDEIQRLAIRIQDRNILYQIIQGGTVTDSVSEVQKRIEVTEELTEAIVEETIATIEITPIETVSEEITPQILEGSSPLLLEPIVNNEPTKQEIVELEIDQISPIEHISPIVEIEGKTVEIEGFTPDLEVNTTENTKINPLETEKNVENQELERQRLIQQLIVKPKIEIIVEKAEEIVEERIEDSQPTRSPSTTSMSFTSWLKTDNVKKENIPQNISEEKLQIPAVYLLTEEEKEPKVIAKGEKKKSFNQIIDKFIKEDPKISSLKKVDQKAPAERAEMYSPLKKAKESVNDAQLPVSETLAKIFVVQGNFPKAIFAYQQLILIFPEKKTFFARQIKELEQKLNTK